MINLLGLKQRKWKIGREQFFSGFYRDAAARKTVIVYDRIRKPIVKELNHA